MIGKARWFHTFAPFSSHRFGISHHITSWSRNGSNWDRCDRISASCKGWDMRGKNHLLILDNLESITGAHLAIQHTLPPDEQAVLRRQTTKAPSGLFARRCLVS